MPDEIKKTTDLTVQQIDKYIKDHTSTKYNKYARYYNGDNPTITDKKKEENPDKRLPIPIARKACNDITCK